MARIHENWLKAYVHHMRYSESPDCFHFWTGVATVAGALRRRVWIDQRQFQWTPNFYIILVGPPGVAAKSTSIRGGLSLLEQVPGIFFGPQSTTWQALMEVLQNAQEAILVPGRAEPEIMSCVTMGVSELGTFFRADNGELVDVLVDMWDGKKEVWRRQTKSQGETIIHNAWLNIIGCTTPSWLKENLPEIFISGGLASRILFVYADKKRQLVAYPGDMVPEKQYKDEGVKLALDLQEIASMVGSYSMSDNAKTWGKNWYEKHWTSARPNHLQSERFDGYFSRKQTHIHKVAIVIAAAKRSKLVIDTEDLIEAEALVSSLEEAMVKVFFSIGGTPEAKKNTEVVALIKTQKEVEYQALWRIFFNSMTGKDFTDAITTAIQAGYLKLETRDGKKYLSYIGPRE